MADGVINSLIDHIGCDLGYDSCKSMEGTRLRSRYYPIRASISIPPDELAFALYITG